ncbi:glycosyltransferase [Roseovarius salis]|uniref:glycosyltransferase n=1 Tax=Roseovarius salis TaxID=3376063 RepID=UPI0037CB66D1
MIFDATKGKDGALLIYAPVPLYRHEGRLFVEDQAAIGLHRWLDNFGRMTAMMPLNEAPPPAGWSPVSVLDDVADRLTLHPLPMAYRPDRFLRALPRARRDIRALIEQHAYLSFAIGGLFGDWGAVSCLMAHRMGRPFAVWTDRVESEVTRLAASEGRLRHRLRDRLTYRPMAMLERAVIRRATLGLFHGRETFDTYAPFSREPHVVHGILVDRADHIPHRALEDKIADAADGPLRIVYAGRAEPMKGPMDWLAVLEALREKGVAFSAAWLGDGAERPAMQARVAQAGLADSVALPGFLSDRQEVLEALREAHVFLFCHRTPESPRNLIEALFSGCPIVGYDGAYARDLIGPNGGGHLVPVGATTTLAGHVACLDSARDRLAGLIRAAHADGERFDAESIYRHRSELIKTYLPG